MIGWMKKEGKKNFRLYCRFITVKIRFVNQFNVFAVSVVALDTGVSPKWTRTMSALKSSSKSLSHKRRGACSRTQTLQIKRFLRSFSFHLWMIDRNKYSSINLHVNYSFSWISVDKKICRTCYRKNWSSYTPMSTIFILSSRNFQLSTAIPKKRAEISRYLKHCYKADQERERKREK